MWGEGVLVRRLLTELTPADLVAAAEAATSAHVVLGVVDTAMHDEDDGMLALAVGPALRRLFPPVKT
jgi:hypothetical protein